MVRLRRLSAARRAVRIPSTSRRSGPFGPNSRPQKFAFCGNLGPHLPHLGDAERPTRASECPPMRSPTQVAALCAAVFVALAVVSKGSAAQFSRASEGRILGAMNQVRAANGLGPLRFDGKLHAAARAHSADMMRRGYFGHGAFNRRMTGFHVHASTVGENLAWGTGPYSAAKAIIQEWLASPEHRANLLRAGFTRVGVGSAVGTFVGRDGATVVTADFAGR